MSPPVIGRDLSSEAFVAVAGKHFGPRRSPECRTEHRGWHVGSDTRLKRQPRLNALRIGCTAGKTLPRERKLVPCRVPERNVSWRFTALHRDLSPAIADAG
jgi:hypothetical protein